MLSSLESSQRFFATISPMYSAESLEVHTRDSGWSAAYLQVEQARLHSVLGQWLNREMERVPFTVEEHEKDFLTQINGLQLNLRVDRIDRVDGGRLILDYKTGKVSPAMWDGERPDEPQLPLYGVHGPVGDLRGVLFAQVRAGDMEFRGRVEDATTTLFKGLDNRSALVSDPLTRETLDEWAKHSERPCGSVSGRATQRSRRSNIRRPAGIARCRRSAGLRRHLSHLTRKTTTRKAKMSRRMLPMVEFSLSELADRKAREDALDTRCSILVQAPAGSGKTELLAMRFLKLLAEVEEPEQVLGITFAKAATAEIRHRIVGKLEKARRYLESGAAPEGEDRSSLAIATAAYTNATQRAWRLSGATTAPQYSDHRFAVPAHRPSDAAELEARRNAAAYRRCHATLSTGGAKDGRPPRRRRRGAERRAARRCSCFETAVSQAARRSWRRCWRRGTKWMRAFPLTGDIDWQAARDRLEEPFQREIDRVLGKAHTLLASHPALSRELVTLASYAGRYVGADRSSSASWLE